VSVFSLDTPWPAVRVVVRLPNWVGDSVMALPAVLALGSALPEAEWILLGGARARPLFEGLDEPFRLLPPLPARVSRPRAFLHVTAMLRREQASAALLFPPSFSSVAMTAAAGIPIRAGMPGDGRSLLLNLRGAPSSRARHLRVQYRALATLLLDRLAPGRSLPPPDEEPERVALRPPELAWATAWRAVHGLDPRQTVALAPGASYGPTKRWPEERFLALARDLLASGRQVLWIGGDDERTSCRRLAEAAGGGAVAAGEVSLRGSVALLAGLSAAVANDSGAMHLAQAAGTPVVGIFGSTAPEWTGPVGGCQETVQMPVPCAPCFATRCPTQVECLTGITVDQVRGALERLLVRTKGSRGRPAVFLDRDGVLLDLVPYLRDPCQVRLARGAGATLRRLSAAGLPFMVVTNQSAVARGMLDRAGLFRVHLRMLHLLEAEGVRPLGIEFCPHHPEHGEPCDCRKPSPGMLRRAAHRFNLDLTRSVMVGDTDSDLQAGRRAGCRTILVRTGYGRETEAAIAAGTVRVEHGGGEMVSPPWVVVDDLGGAVDAILAAL
jgi:lipopolysaccharide heptosyltransferase II